MNTTSLRAILAALAAVAATLLPGAVQAADLLSQQCVACHAIAKPEKASLERILERKGPDLHYAGAKFNQEWLVAWLQNPTTIRPGGAMFLHAVKAGADRSVDTIDAAKVAPHPKLSAADAKTAAELLMALKPDGLVTPGAHKGEPGGSMASMLFSKLRGCTSCHAAKPGDPPLSGPELYSAGARLQPDFMLAYMKDPQRFDPHTWMPTLGLTDADMQKLTSYMSTLKNQEKK